MKIPHCFQVNSVLSHLKEMDNDPFQKRINLQRLMNNARTAACSSFIPACL